MTQLTDICRRIDDAIAANTDIVLAPTELTALLKIASLVNGQGAAAPVPQPVPAPEPTQQILTLMTLQEAADLIKVSRRTLWLCRKNDPTFPAVVRTSARHKMVVRSEFEAWVLSRR